MFASARTRAAGGLWSTRPAACSRLRWEAEGVHQMNNIIYLIGLVVVVVAILGYFGLR